MKLHNIILWVLGLIVFNTIVMFGVSVTCRSHNNIYKYIKLLQSFSLVDYNNLNQRFDC